MDQQTERPRIQRAYNPSSFKHDADKPTSEGMTLRDYALLQCLNGALASGARGDEAMEVARVHAKLAIKELNADRR